MKPHSMSVLVIEIFTHITEIDVPFSAPLKKKFESKKLMKPHTKSESVFEFLTHRCITYCFATLVKRSP